MEKFKNKIMIAPSILSADFSDMGRAVEEAEQYGADLIHCDVMDGNYVPNITFGPKLIKDIRKRTNLPLDVHLMIDRPERYVDHFIDAGADIITFHIEATNQSEKILQRIHNAEILGGMVISPDTQVSSLKDYIVMCDITLLMSVYPGFGGQKFLEKSYERLKELHSMIQAIKKNVLLEIDGGVNFENSAAIKECGAQILVAGNTVFTAQDKKAAIERLRNY